METLKAIQTVYNGYHFRSRLEARWAVFFDALKIPYEYEKEGYELESGWYLPDFWLPDQQYWLEIKGCYPNKQELLLAYELCLASKSDIYILYEQIELPNGYGVKNNVHIMSYDKYYDEEANQWIEDVHDQDDGYTWGECGKCGAVGIGYEGTHIYYHKIDCEYFGNPPESIGRADSDRLYDAFLQARQARFEHSKKINSNDKAEIPIRTTGMCINCRKAIYFSPNHGGNWLHIHNQAYLCEFLGGITQQNIAEPQRR